MTEVNARLRVRGDRIAVSSERLTRLVSVVWLMLGIGMASLLSLSSQTATTGRSGFRACQPGQIGTPTIDGVVLDQNNRPIHGALVSLKSIGGIAICVATDSSGSFVASVPTGVVFGVTAECNGYYPFPWRDTTELNVTSQSPRVSICLTKRELTTFSVIDSQSGKPITTFALKIADEPTVNVKGIRSYTVSRSSSEIVTHSDGQVDRMAEPGRHVYQVIAPGYAPKIGFVQHPDPTDRRQEIRLERGSTVRGRITRDERPIVGTVVFCRDELLGALGDEIEARIVELRGEELLGDLVDCFEHRDSRVETDANGAFVFSDLPVGAYTIWTLPSNHSMHTLPEMFVGSASDISNLVIDVK